MSSTVIKRPRDTNDDDASGGGPAAAKRQNNKLRIKLVGRRAGSDRDEKKVLTFGGGLLVGDLRSQGVTFTSTFYTHVATRPCPPFRDAPTGAAVPLLTGEF